MLLHALSSVSTRGRCAHEQKHRNESDELMFPEVIRIISNDDFRLINAKYVFNGSRRIPDPAEPQTQYAHQSHPSKGLPHAVRE